MLKSIDEGTKVLIVGIIFAVMLIFILLVPVKKQDYSNVDKYLNKINNNYTIVINDKTMYSRDKDVEVFENAEDKHFKYNNKIYHLVDDTATEVESATILEDKYCYDIDLLKKVNQYCEYSSIASGVTACKVSAEEYNKELTNMYGIGRLNTNDVTITYYYINENIDRIGIDFKDNKYDIQIKSINNNNFSDLISLVK